jgi:hypothetical protein
LWEPELDFSPHDITPPPPRWVCFDGLEPDKSKGMTVNNAHISEQFLQDVLHGEKLADVTLLIFRDPKRFTAGNLHSKIDQWQFISAHSPYQETPIVLDWIQNNVNVHDFFRPFKGDFKGESFSSDVPPAKLFTNSPIMQTVFDVHFKYYPRASGLRCHLGVGKGWKRPSSKARNALDG